MAYVSIQSFERTFNAGLSKLIPTALATGTFNAGLLATLVDTFGGHVHCADGVLEYAPME